MRISDWSSDVCALPIFLVDVRLDRDIFLDRGAARQGLALVALEIHERETGCVAMVDLSVHDMHLAGRTQAVAARMREIDAGAECGIEDGLSFLDGHARPQWLDGEFVCHRRTGIGNSAMGNGVIMRI